MRAPLRGGSIDVLSQQQARALAHFIHLIRDDWNEEGVYKKLGEVRDCDTFAVALAAIRAARDPGARTPGVIPNQAGPHWRELTGQVPRTERRSMNVPCPEHPDQTLPCRRCAANRVPADNHTAQLRAQLATAKANLCPCGVQPNTCADHNPTAVAAERARRHPTPKETDDE